MSRYAMCPECGHRMRRVLDSWGNWDGETYCCDYCTGADYEEADDDGESLSVYDAALIWASNGKDRLTTYSDLPAFLDKQMKEFCLL